MIRVFVSETIWEDVPGAVHIDTNQDRLILMNKFKEVIKVYPKGTWTYMRYMFDPNAPVINKRINVCPI